MSLLPGATVGPAPDAIDATHRVASARSFHFHQTGGQPRPACWIFARRRRRRTPGATSSTRGRTTDRNPSSALFFYDKTWLRFTKPMSFGVGPELAPADVHVVFADDGLLVAADAAPAAALAELLRVAVDEGLGAHLRQHTRNGYGERKPVGGPPGERRRSVRAVLCVFACGDGVNASTACRGSRLAAVAARVAPLPDALRVDPWLRSRSPPLTTRLGRASRLRRWFSAF